MCETFVMASLRTPTTLFALASLLALTTACPDKDVDDDVGEEAGQDEESDSSTGSTGDTTTGEEESSESMGSESTTDAGTEETTESAEESSESTEETDDGACVPDGDDEMGALEPPLDDEPDYPHGGTFIPEEDIPVVEACDPWVQDCVPGEKCVPYAAGGGTWNANKCVPVLGDKAVGDECIWDGIMAATDDCDGESACWGMIDNIGTCTAFCEGTPQNPICPEGTICSISNQGSVTFCLEGCNPITQDMCPDGNGCYYDGVAFSCAPTTSDIPAGDPCSFINDCEAGLVCLDGSVVPGCTDSACCAEFCDLDCPLCSDPQAECVALFQGNAPVGDDDVGACILP